MTAVSELKILARLHTFGLLPEVQRLEALGTVSDLALDVPDAGWLNIGAVSELFSDQERRALLDRVRRELIPDFDRMFFNWSINEQGESAEEYYQPLEEALQRYASALEDDAEAHAAFQTALRRVDEVRTEADHWQDDEEAPAGGPRSSASNDAPWRMPVAKDKPSHRNMFDDVDA